MTYRVSAKRHPERLASYVTGSKAPVFFGLLAIGLGAAAFVLRNPDAPVAITAASAASLMLAIYMFLARIVKVSVDYDDETDAISVERMTGLRRTVVTFARNDVREVNAMRVVLQDDRVVPVTLDEEQVERLEALL